MISILAFALSLSLATGCSGRKSAPDHPLRFDFSRNPGTVKMLWLQNLKSLMADVAISKNGKSVLVATSPDNEAEPATHAHALYRFSADGQIQWKKETSARVRTISVSDDGDFTMVSTVDEKVSALDHSGKPLWEIEGVCKPFVLSRAKKVICYHDDDAEPGVAFDVFDFKGRKLFSHPISEDILSLKISEDEQNLAIGLTGGKVILFGKGFQTVWRTKVSGEVLDVAVSSGDTPRVAVLFENHRKNETPVQRIGVMGKGGVLHVQGEARGHSEQIEIAPDGSVVFAYGNGPRGQYLGSYAVPSARGVLLEKWKQEDSRYASYSSAISVTRDLIVMGYEDISAGSRHSHLLGFDFTGRLKWNVPLVTEEGAFLFAHAFSAETQTMAVATDDGILTVYRVARAPL